MRHSSADDHACAEDDEDVAVADGGFVAGLRAEAVVDGEDLDEDGAEFAGTGADAVAGGAVAGWEDFGGDDVGCCVGACLLLVCCMDGVVGGGNEPKLNRICPMM